MSENNYPEEILQRGLDYADARLRVLASYAITNTNANTQDDYITGKWVNGELTAVTQQAKPKYQAETHLEQTALKILEAKCIDGSARNPTRPLSNLATFQEIQDIRMQIAAVECERLTKIFAQRQKD